jgi:TRAP-type C4-dicarboxylate transport system permease large subunit
VIFGVAANVSISKLFMAGIVPGVWLGIVAVVHLVVAGAQGKVAPPPRKSRPKCCRRCGSATWALVLPSSSWWA